MNRWLPLLEHLAAAWPPERWQNVTVLLAVSGGADSIALLRAMHALPSSGAGRLVVAHFHHRLRPSADEDEAFVRQLCGDLGLAYEVGYAEPEQAATAHGEGPESRLRRARYQFLQTTAERVGARYVATAHTADDQAETILHRILRGTGLAGLGGIRRTRRLGPATTLIRPLLGFSRGELLAFLDQLGQPFREDETNRDERYTRNRIRHDLLPKLRADYNPYVDAALQRLGQLAGEAQQWVQYEVERLFDRSVVFTDDRARLDCEALRGEHPYLIRELLLALWRRQHWPLRDMSHAKWQQVLRLVLSASEQPLPQQTLPGGIRAQRAGTALLLRRLPNDAAD